MDSIQYLKLVADARAFRQSAWLVEREIGRLGAKPGETAPLGGAAGWPSQTVWEALKTASHFNLGIAFELRVEMRLWEKRYSWEAVSEGVWRHYVENLDPLLAFVDKIESLGAELARKKRLIS